MRGMSGSGKDTWLRNLKENGPDIQILSADSWFDMQAHFNGTSYREEFSIDKQEDAHIFCMQGFIRVVTDTHNHGMPIVAVSNTNSTLLQIAPYVAVGKALRKHIRVVEIRAPIDVCLARNLHGTPESTILRQFNNLNWSRENWPKRWPEIEIVSYHP